MCWSTIHAFSHTCTYTRLHKDTDKLSFNFACLHSCIELRKAKPLCVCLSFFVRITGRESEELPKHDKVQTRVSKKEYKRAVKLLKDMDRIVYLAGGSGGGSRYILSHAASLHSLELSFQRLLNQRVTAPRRSALKKVYYIHVYKHAHAHMYAHAHTCTHILSHAASLHSLELSFQRLLDQRVTAPRRPALQKVDTHMCMINMYACTRSHTCMYARAHANTHTGTHTLMFTRLAHSDVR